MLKKHPSRNGRNIAGIQVKIKRVKAFKNEGSGRWDRGVALIGPRPAGPAVGDSSSEWPGPGRGGAGGTRSITVRVSLSLLFNPTAPLEGAASNNSKKVAGI